MHLIFPRTIPASCFSTLFSVACLRWPLLQRTFALDASNVPIHTQLLHLLGPLSLFAPPSRPSTRHHFPRPDASSPHPAFPRPIIPSRMTLTRANRRTAELNEWISTLQRPHFPVQGSTSHEHGFRLAVRRLFESTSPWIWTICRCKRENSAIHCTHMFDRQPR